MENVEFNWERIAFFMRFLGVRRVFKPRLIDDYGIIEIAVDNKELLEVTNPESYLEGLYNRKFKVIQLTEDMKDNYEEIRINKIICE